MNVPFVVLKKPVYDIAFIDCVKKGIYTINIGRRTTLRHPICTDCEKNAIIYVHFVDHMVLQIVLNIHLKKV